MDSSIRTVDGGWEGSKSGSKSAQYSHHADILCCITPMAIADLYLPPDVVTMK